VRDVVEWSIRPDVTQGRAACPGAPADTRPISERFASSLGQGRLGCWKRTALCLPALLAGVTAASLAVSVWLRNEAQLVNDYIDEAERCTRLSELPRARVCFERLMQAGYQTPKAQYRLALVLDGLGEPGQARALMVRLAPLGAPDKPGYGPAHLWQAHELLHRADRFPRDLRDAEAHLLHALQDTPGCADAHALLGQLYASTGRPREAEAHLDKVVGERPELLLLLAAACAAQRKEAQARVRAGEALKVFRARVSVRPDDHESRLRWAAAALFIEDYPRAEAILREGLDRGEAPEFRRALAGVYLAWHDAPPAALVPDAGGQLGLLELGLRQDPTNQALLDRLERHLRGAGTESESARAALVSLLADGRATASAHFLLGLDAWRHGRGDEARFHWEAAHGQAPEVVAYTNNLAWALASAPAPDLNRALDLINAALRRSPSMQALRGTRGRVLVRMKRWHEALADLEAALPVERGTPELHLDLAVAYDALGLPEPAAEHRRHASRLPKGAEIARDNPPG
jgi:tetratricopeptide (TPR) repeat protein